MLAGTGLGLPQTRPQRPFNPLAVPHPHNYCRSCTEVEVGGLEVETVGEVVVVEGMAAEKVVPEAAVLPGSAEHVTPRKRCNPTWLHPSCTYNCTAVVGNSCPAWWGLAVLHW